MKLYDHQKKIIEADPKKALIALGTGGGKTLVCLCLGKKRTLIVVAKQQKLDKTWEQNNEKFGVNRDITVVSKEEFRRDWQTYDAYDTLIVDECHYMLGMLPDMRVVKGVEVPKTSQMFDSLRGYIRKHDPERIYLASATPAAKAMNVFALGMIFGKKWNFYEFRNRYYIKKKIGYRSIYLQRSDEKSKNELATLIRNFGYTGQLSDWFDVPEQVPLEKYFSLSEEQKKAIKEVVKTEADPMTARTKQRSIENGVLYSDEVFAINAKEDRMKKVTKLFPNDKLEYIVERAQEFKKMLIFAAYTGQVHQIAERLKEEGYNVSTLTGQTKNRGDVIKNAEEAEQMFVVAQSGISSGYELKSFRVMVFASKSWKVLDYTQGLGRFLRADNLHKNLYIHLITKGGVDQACHESILDGHDFQERIYE